MESISVPIIFQKRGKMLVISFDTVILFLAESVFITEYYKRGSHYSPFKKKNQKFPEDGISRFLK